MVEAPVDAPTAAIPRLSTGESSPAIDGKLDDEAWKNAAQLGPFENFRTSFHPMETRTTARMIYDDTNLYIAFRCEDPAMDNLSIGNIQDQEGEPIGAGDFIQVTIGTDEEASTYYNITIGYNNQRWDALTPRGDFPNEISGTNSSWDGEYETATRVEETFWSVEMAIPWATLNRQTPKAGEKIKGNLILRSSRGTYGLPELSSWSLMIMARNIEAKGFGTWEFK